MLKALACCPSPVRPLSDTHPHPTLVPCLLNARVQVNVEVSRGWLHALGGKIPLNFIKVSQPGLHIAVINTALEFRGLFKRCKPIDFARGPIYSTQCNSARRWWGHFYLLLCFVVDSVGGLLFCVVDQLVRRMISHFMRTSVFQDLGRHRSMLVLNAPRSVASSCVLVCCGSPFLSWLRGRERLSWSTTTPS